jgi:RNA polymerase sigma factor (TIGR02999 family)
LIGNMEEVFRREYGRILALARARLARERAPISTVTLAHELYLNLRDRGDLEFASREQFFGYVSRAMRSLLIDMARERVALKRSAELLPLTFGSQVQDQGGTPEQLVALEEALTSLGQLEERLMRVAEMRIFMDMEIGEIATALEVSEPTVKRDWRRAKSFIFDRIGASA